MTLKPTARSLVPALLLSTALGLAACGDGGSDGASQPTGDPTSSTEAQTGNDTAKAGGVTIGADEITLGNPDAPVTMIEYASMTCPACARFHNDIYPEFKERYIETGKVYFVFRPFPLDPVAARASMLLKCLEPDQVQSMIDIMFETQQSWAGSGNPDENLTALAGNAGMTPADVQACYSDTDKIAWLDGIYRDGQAKYSDTAYDPPRFFTPTFVIDGKRVVGIQRIEDLEALIGDVAGAG
ncbi:MAG: DsbA family protein [Pseudomonadota bacterium]